MRSKLTYANLMSTVAAFLALAGGSTAIALKGKNSVKAKDIASNAVQARHIAKGAVRSWEVRNETLKRADIAAGGVGSSEILDGSVTAADLGSGAVTSAKLLDGSVGTSKLGSVPAARVQNAGGHSVSANSLVVGAPFTSDSGSGRYNPYGMWAPDNPGDVVVPEDGIYLAVGEVNWAADDTASPGPPADNGLRIAEITSSGNGTASSRMPPIRHSVTEQTIQQVSGVFAMKAGDSFGLTIYQTNEDSSAIVAFLNLSVTWLAPGI